MSSSREFHQARWSEPIVLDLGGRGQRAIDLPGCDRSMPALSIDEAVPAGMRRLRPPRLPELSQPEVLRHFLRLSQETMGNAIGVDIGQGTATMKYSPKVNDRLSRSSRLADLHPLQPAGTAQGVLEIMHRFERILREISGLDRFSFQPGGGTHGIYANACVMRAYHASRGEAGLRDEVITTLFSHPADAAAPATAGFKVITLAPTERGYPELDALKAAVSERTAGLVLANPEDTGIFNPEIDRFVEVVHDAGGLCVYDQANANGILGITRAADSGFDLCQFNLHKTFSSPHASGGLACGAIGARSELARFLPVPTVELRDDRFVLDYDRPDSIGAVRAFHGVVSAVVRSYAWVCALGPEGLREAAEVAVLNNNYLARRLAELPGIDVSFAAGNQQPRLEQVRYTLEELTERTGIGTGDVSRRTSDFGVSGYFPSHHPWFVREPMTLEPTESVTKDDLDAYVAIMRRTLEEAHTEPELVRSSPHRCATHRIDERALDDPACWALTWRAYLRKRKAAADG